MAPENGRETPRLRIELSQQRKAQAASAWLVFREACRAFGADKNLQTAAMLAYYGFLSLMPLLLLAVYVLSHIMRSSESVFEGMQVVMHRLVPTFSDAVLSDLLRLSSQKTWGLVSIVVLLWSMTPFAGALRHAFVRIFKSDRKLSYVRTKLLDLGTVLVLLTCFVFLVVGNMLYSFKIELVFPLAPWLLTALKQLALLVLTVGVLMGFGYVFAPVRLRASLVLTGALVSTLLFAAMRPMFELMLHYNPNYGYAFGSLKAIFLLIVWVYYTFAVLLFSGEVMATAWRKDALLLRGFLAQAPMRSKRMSILLDKFMRQADDGDVLFREGESGQDMFYVLNGAVRLTKGDHVLRTMGAGEYFGEMSMLTGAARTATATVAAPETTLVAIAQNNFDTILRENPSVVLAILKEMALRLKATNEQLQRTTM
jgi:membrane protein